MQVEDKISQHGISIQNEVLTCDLNSHLLLRCRLPSAIDTSFNNTLIYAESPRQCESTGHSGLKSQGVGKSWPVAVSKLDKKGRSLKAVPRVIRRQLG